MTQDPPPPNATNRVRELATEQGFALVGIAAAAPSDHADHFHRWLQQGHHGEMHYLAQHVDKRLDVRKLLPEQAAQAVICVADRYPHQPATPLADTPDPPAARGRVARYAWGDDYHKLIKKRLHRVVDALREAFPSHAFQACVDTAPVMEREHASRAGLGWQGKHTLLIHPTLGSYLLLGEIVTNLPLPDTASEDYPPPTVPPEDHCGSCTRCIDACPTGCIEPYQLDAARCISYLTLEHRSLIDAEMHPAMGDWVAGCDVCQEVCPYNRPQRIDPVAHHPGYQPRPLAEGLPLLELLHISAADRQALFTRSALKRIKLDMLQRNALIAAGNALLGTDPTLPEPHRTALRNRIDELANDDTQPELVRHTAQQVQHRLTEPQR